MENSNKVTAQCKEGKKLVLKKMALFILLVCGGVSYSQSKVVKIPGSENYDSTCSIVYSNAYKDGFACASGNKALCGYYPAANSACETANREGYNEGYVAGNKYKEVNSSGSNERVSVIWQNFLKSLKID
jgi:hypothetical protein